MDGQRGSLLIGRRSLLLASVGAGVWLGAGCSRPTGDGPPSGTAKAPIPTPGEPEEVPLPECPRTVGASMGIVQGKAAAPRCDGELWVFELPAMAHPTDRRRSEIGVGRRKGDTYRSGERISVAINFRAWLGQAADTRDDWQQVWQLHGPVAGEWRGPSVAAVVRQGSWYLSGGAGHPAHGVDGQDFFWEKRLGAFRDGEWHRIQVSVLLSTDPDRGRISCQLDEGIAIPDFVPQSQQGLRPGTMPPGQSHVTCRVGLYRGTLNGSMPPRYRQAVEAVVQSLS